MSKGLKGISDGSIDRFGWNFWGPNFHLWQVESSGKFGAWVLLRKLQYKDFVPQWNVFKDGVKKWGKRFTRGGRLRFCTRKLIGNVKETKRVRYVQWKSNINPSGASKQVFWVEIKTGFCAIKGRIWIKFDPFVTIAVWNSSSVLLKDENHIAGFGHPWCWVFQVIERNGRWRKWRW